ncbi:MAG: hypothetical protein IJ752_01395 [Alphaproteobacteria bacterium]|nr:hypothetical protein [Alphaproteobacteria bacterium]
MKAFVVLVILLGGAGYWLYSNGFFDSFLESFDNTVQRTSDFATDRKVKEAKFD